MQFSAIGSCRMDDELIAFIDDNVRRIPSQFLNSEPTNDAILVKRALFGIDCLVDQVGKTFCRETQALVSALIYKHSAPQRHQKAWSFFRSFAKSLRDFRSLAFLKKLTLLQKKMRSSGSDYYMIAEDFLRYIGCCFLRRVFILQKINNYCLKTSESFLGQIEVGHWENLALIVIALCAEVNSALRLQLNELNAAYQQMSKLFKDADKRFPENLESMEVYKVLLSSTKIRDKNPNLKKLADLLKFSEKKMEEADAVNELDTLRNEILESITNSSAQPVETSVGVPVERQTQLFAEEEESYEQLLVSPQLFRSSKKNSNEPPCDSGERKRLRRKRKRKNYLKPDTLHVPSTEIVSSEPIAAGVTTLKIKKKKKMGAILRESEIQVDFECSTKGSDVVMLKTVRKKLKRVKKKGKHGK